MLHDSICAYVNSWLLQRGNWGWSKPCHDTILARLNTQFPGNFMAKPDLGRVGSWPGGHRGCRSFRKSTATMRHGGRTSGFFHLGCGWSQQSSRLPSHGGGDEDFEVYFREDGWQGWPAANALDGTRRIGNPKCLQCWNFVCGTSGSLWATQPQQLFPAWSPSLCHVTLLASQMSRYWQLGRISSLIQATFWDSLGLNRAHNLKLVGGFNPSEKYEFVSWDDGMSNIWKVIKIMFRTTNQKSWPYQNTTTTTGHTRMRPWPKPLQWAPRPAPNHVAGNVCMLHAIEHETTVVTTSHESQGHGAQFTQHGASDAEQEAICLVQHRIDEEDVLKCSRPSLFTHYQRLPPTQPIQVNKLCTENVACLSVYPITSRLYHRPQYLPSSNKCGPLNWRDMPGHPVMFCAGVACSNPVVLHMFDSFWDEDPKGLMWFSSCTLKSYLNPLVYHHVPYIFMAMLWPFYGCPHVQTQPCLAFRQDG